MLFTENCSPIPSFCSEKKKIIVCCYFTETTTMGIKTVFSIEMCFVFSLNKGGFAKGSINSTQLVASLKITIRARPLLSKNVWSYFTLWLMAICVVIPNTQLYFCTKYKRNKKNLKDQTKFFISLLYYAIACNEFGSQSPRHCAGVTQFHLSVQILFVSCFPKNVG